MKNPTLGMMPLNTRLAISKTKSKPMNKPGILASIPVKGKPVMQNTKSKKGKSNVKAC